MLLFGFPLEDIPRKVTSHSFLRQIIMVGDCYVKGFWQCPLHLTNVRYTICTHCTAICGFFFLPSSGVDLIPH